MIHCIGDSHASVFSGSEGMVDIYPPKTYNETPYFSAYRIGPATAFQLEGKRFIIDRVLSENYCNGDMLLFCFGEVDCRAHLLNQVKLQNTTEENIVKQCVDRYFNVILSYKNLGYNVGVWGVIGSWSEKRPYGSPSFGNNIERNRITKKFNDYISQLCVEQSIPFVSVFEEMLNDDMTTKEWYLDDWAGCHIHLKQNIMPLIINKFKAAGLI